MLFDTLGYRTYYYFFYISLLLRYLDYVPKHQTFLQVIGYKPKQYLLAMTSFVWQYHLQLNCVRHIACISCLFLVLLVMF